MVNKSESCVPVYKIERVNKFKTEPINKETVVEKNLHIFDFDYTLYIDCTKCFRFISKCENCMEYKDYIIQYIKDLKDMGKKIAMASHNETAENYLFNHYKEIHSCFDIFICEYPRNKDTMVMEILNQFDCNPGDAIFYDDMETNTTLVAKLGVETYLVDPWKGIYFEEDARINIKN